jgi:uncharacterized protein YbbC (DUF1343 family)
MFFVAAACGTGQGSPPAVKTGADILLRERLDLLKGKRVGVITNQTGRCASGEHLVDALVRKGVNVVRLFGPEHGIRGAAAPGEQISDTVDVGSGIPVVSLYGIISKPTRTMLRDVDVLVYDIQDVGARFYTYVSTMVLCMEAAAEASIPFVVLDRPNPLGGTLVDGPVLADSLRSFVGIIPIPVVYGLTCGELARYVNGEGLLKGGIRADLIVVAAQGWTRTMSWNETGLQWIPPSPNIPDPETAIVYPAICFLEATNLSEGRGTSKPFKTLGAPFIDPVQFASDLNALTIPGVGFDTVSFTPTASKHQGKLCRGVAISVVDRDRFRPVRTALCILREILRSYPDDLEIDRRWFVKLMGSAQVYGHLRSSVSVDSLTATWKAETAEFESKREKYLLYAPTPASSTKRLKF